MREAEKCARLLMLLSFVFVAELLSGPTDVNTSLGSIAQFHCIGKGFVVVWLINKTSAFTIDSPLIATSQNDEDDGTLIAVLNITATSERNNSRIECYVHDKSSNSIISPVVMLKVQGMQGKTIHTIY